jgi:hypothetical protein
MAKNRVQKAERSTTSPSTSIQTPSISDAFAHWATSIVLPKPDPPRTTVIVWRSSRRSTRSGRRMAQAGSIGAPYTVVFRRAPPPGLSARPTAGRFDALVPSPSDLRTRSLIPVMWPPPVSTEPDGNTLLTQNGRLGSA